MFKNVFYISPITYMARKAHQFPVSQRTILGGPKEAGLLCHGTNFMEHSHPTPKLSFISLIPKPFYNQ